MTGAGGDTAHHHHERYIIYSVSKEEYDTCRVERPNPRVVAMCDQQQQQQLAASKSGKPAAATPFTITFRNYSPTPNAMEFKAGQDYYFITALIGPTDSARRFSPCREQNMKVIFKVCCKPPPASSSSAGGAANNGGQQPLRLSGQQQASLVKSPRSEVPLQVGVASRSKQQLQQQPAVVTLRPSLLLSQQNAAGEYNNNPLRALANAAQQSASSQQQQQQPITVLPLEVLQPSTSEAPPTSSSSGSSSSDPSLDVNDIIVPASEPAPMPAASTVNSLLRFPSSSAGSIFGPAAGSPYLGRLHPQQPQQQQPPPFIRFDPTAAPSELISRYAPTRLPANFAAASAPLNQQQSSSAATQNNNFPPPLLQPAYHPAHPAHHQHPQLPVVQVQQEPWRRIRPAASLHGPGSSNPAAAHFSPYWPYEHQSIQSKSLKAEQQPATSSAHKSCSLNFTNSLLVGAVSLFLLFAQLTTTTSGDNYNVRRRITSGAIR